MSYKWTRAVISFHGTTTLDKIKEFRLLPMGWHCGEGMAPSPNVIGDALKIALRAIKTGLSETDAFAGVNGEVRVTIYSGEDYLEFTVEPNRRVTYVREHNGEEITYQQNLRLDDVLSILGEFGRNLWVSFGSSTTGTMITDLGAFRHLHSETHPMVPEYL